MSNKVDPSFQNVLAKMSHLLFSATNPHGITRANISKEILWLITDKSGSADATIPTKSQAKTIQFGN